MQRQNQQQQQEKQGGDGGEETALLTCSFNQDGGCLAVGTTTGFSVHNLHPQYAVSVQRTLQGGVGSVEMLFRCNLMALVGGGPTPQAPPHRVLIWDDHIPKEIGELSFRQTVLAVRLRKDAIAVALRDRCYVYHLADLSLRDKIYTADNPDGLLSLSTQIQDMVLACPSVTTGHVRAELYGLRKTVLLEAHESALRGLSLTSDGAKLATASVKGTVIRVWSVATASCLQEFRRGVERATIRSLAWSWEDGARWLACCSDKGTTHVFEVDAAAATSSGGNSQEEKKMGGDAASGGGGGGTSTCPSESGGGVSSSFTSMLMGAVRYSVGGGDAPRQTKSFCQIRGVPHPIAASFVGGAPNTVAVAGWDADGNGVLLLSEFDPRHQHGHPEPKRVGYHVLVRSAEAEKRSLAETEEERRRRRLRGWTPSVPQTPEGGRLYVGERLEILERGMEQIRFEEDKDGEDFVGVTTVPIEEGGDSNDDDKKQNGGNGADPVPPTSSDRNRNGGGGAEAATTAPCSNDASEVAEDVGTRSNNSSNIVDSGTVGDSTSVRTEPLDDVEMVDAVQGEETQ